MKKFFNQPVREILAAAAVVCLLAGALVPPGHGWYEAAIVLAILSETYAVDHE